MVSHFPLNLKSKTNTTKSFTFIEIFYKTYYNLILYKKKILDQRNLCQTYFLKILVLILLHSQYVVPVNKLNGNAMSFSNVFVVIIKHSMCIIDWNEIKCIGEKVPFLLISKDFTNKNSNLV